MTHGHPHISTIEAHDQEIALNGNRRTNDATPNIPRSPVDPNEGMSPAGGPLEGTGIHTVRGFSSPFFILRPPMHRQRDYVVGHEHQTFGNPKANYTVQGSWDKPPHVYQTPMDYKSRLTSPSQARGAQTLSRTSSSASYGRPPMHDHGVSMSQHNDFGPVSYGIPFRAAESNSHLEFLYNSGSCGVPTERAPCGNKAFLRATTVKPCPR